jgi:type IV secretory pathway VirB2 component (pilin)
MDNVLSSPLGFSLLLVGFGIVVFAVIWLFGHHLTQTKAIVIEPNQLQQLLEFYEKTSQHTNPLWHLANASADHLQRRNEFWTTYVQTAAAVVIVIVIALLLLADKINADAALPILSAISGFVIAKSVSAGRSSGNDAAPPR